MKKQKGYELRDVCGQKVILASGFESIDIDRMFILNDSAAFLFDAMGEDEFEVNDLVKKLLDEYNVTEDRALQSVNSFLVEMKKCGVVK